MNLGSLLSCFYTDTCCMLEITILYPNHVMIILNANNKIWCKMWFTDYCFHFQTTWLMTVWLSTHGWWQCDYPHMVDDSVIIYTWSMTVWLSTQGRWQCDYPHMVDDSVIIHTWSMTVWLSTHGRWQCDYPVAIFISLNTTDLHFQMMKTWK